MGNHRVLNFPNLPVSGILHEIQMQGLTVFNKEKPSACKKYKKREKLILKWTPHDIWHIDVNKIYWIGKMDYWESGMNWGFALLVVVVTMYICWAFAG